MHRIDNTSISIFKECPRKWHYGMQLGLRPNSYAAPLEFGGAYHACLEVFDDLLAKGKSRDDALRETIREAFRVSAPTLEDGSPSPFAQATAGDTARTRTTLVRTLIWYEEHYRNEIAGDMQTYVLASGEPAVELSFSFELPVEFFNPETNQMEPAHYTGHIDKIVTYQGRLFAMERKHTKNSFYDSYWNRYINSSQIDGYIYASHVNFNLEVGGCIIDATQFQVNSSRFARRVVTRTPERRHEWLLETLYWLHQLDSCIKSDYFPRNTESCSKYSGCQFYELCFAHKDVQPAIMREHFRVEKWDPTKIRGDD